MTQPAAARIRAQLVIGSAITPASDFDELPDPVLHAMIAGMYGLEDQPELVNDAFAWAAPALKAAFETGAGHGYHFQPHWNARRRPAISDAMIEAFEPNLIREESAPAGIVAFFEQTRAAFDRALAAAERQCFYYRFSEPAITA